MKANDTAASLEAALRSVEEIQHVYNDFLTRINQLHSMPALEEATPRLRELQKNLNELHAEGSAEQHNLNGTLIHLLNELVEYVAHSSGKMKDLLQYQMSFFLQITPWIDVKLEALRTELRQLILKERPSFPDIHPGKFDAERIKVELEDLRNTVSRNLGSAGSHGKEEGALQMSSDFSSAAFSQIFRGDRQWLLERWRSYLPYFENGPEPVVDIGCGKGEFLEIVKETGKEVLGIELNQHEAQKLNEKGYTIVTEDAVSYLERRDPESIGGVFCAQVAEHLTPAQLQRMLARLHTVMKSGAALVIETVNPVSVFALHNVYFKDPTHIFPIHPETLVFLFRYAGFKNVQAKGLSPIPDEQKLRMPDEIEDPALRAYLQKVVTRLNEVIFDDLEYFVVGYR